MPKYNGIDITALQGNNIANPTVATERFASPLVLGGMTYRTRANVTHLPDHNISWPMYLPPTPIGMWTANTKVTGRDLKERLEVLYLSRSEVGKPVPERFDFKKYPWLLNARTMYTVRIKPMPSAAEFMSHIENHECQHVADHIWLAERVIGWWDSWLNTVKKNGVSVVSTSTSLPALASGFSYSVGVPRIITYWCRAAAQSGDLYHKSREGAHPVIQISELTEDSVTLTVTPRTMIHRRPMLINPAPHQEMAFQTNSLDGNEPRLKAGPCPQNPFSESKWRKINQWFWAWNG